MTEHALVFDIKRFAVHDGSGIRTTVFFKGCGMRCRWCQNPEGLNSEQQVVWLKNRCIHCGSCAAHALTGQMDYTNGVPVFHRDYDGDYDNLIRICPTGAICYDSRWYTVDELLAEIRKDEVFYHYGGGVTFSGGEPLLQGNFLIHCLQECRREGIHTAIETALFADPVILKGAAPYIDSFFTDFKCADPIRHKEITGTDNHLILENLSWILQNITVPITVRTPLIPGYTATKDNIAAIARFIAQHNPNAVYELLNYNELAPAKYEMTGLLYEPGERRRFTETEMEEFRHTARENGVYNVI